jgi:UDP-N-acetyl-D-glucosamine dehydrogenase
MASAAQPQPRVVVVGQGYVGLPLAVAAADAGMDVTGVDSDKRRVDQLNAGSSPVGDVSGAALAAVVSSGRYRASADFDAVAQADVVVLCVPTPYRDSGPDLSFIEAAAASVAAHLRRGALVILESTTYPGTTEELLRPVLESGSGLRAGEAFHLVFSPERIDPGNAQYGLRNTPKIVGGLAAEGTEKAAAFYGAFVEHVVPVSNPKTAEMAKLLENTFRHINIALVNELAILSQDLGVDIWEVIDAAASKPVGFMPFYPGPGVGGHCIPVDPLYLSWRVRQFGGAAKFIELARDVNAAMPAYCVTRVQDLLNDRAKPLRGARILVLGVAYKPGVADLRESPAMPILDMLLRKGADVSYHDEFVPSLVIAGRVIDSVPLTEAAVASSDAVVVVTNHPDVDYSWVVAHAEVVFDSRRTVPPAANVVRL